MKRSREGDGDEREDEDVQEHRRQMVDVVMCVNEVAEENMVGEGWGVDDISGEALEEEDVRGARAEELAFMHKFGVYEEAWVDECWAATGRPPITTKWIDRDKGCGGEKEIRSRWVAKDFKVKGDKDREDLFAAMPPLEAKKVLFKMAASRMTGRSTLRGRRMKMVFIDVRKAHLNGVCEDEVYVDPP